MATLQPKAGKCGARLTKRRGPNDEQLYCGHDPLPGRTRCKFHGGASTGPKTPEGKARVSQNNLKHGLYAKALKQTHAAMGIPEELWEAIPGETTLTEEIKAARANVIRYAMMLAKGEKWIDSCGPATISVETLYQESLKVLRSLVKTQHEINPGAGVAGNLHVSFTVSTDATATVGGEIPKLTEDEAPIDDGPPSLADGPEDIERDELSGYEDEDED
jgi:hypothetical protein